MKQKSENRQAMPKFILIVVCSLIIGALIGFGIVFADGDWTAAFGESLAGALATAAPWLLYGSVLISAATMFALYHKVKKIHKTWKEEDEAALQKMDSLLMGAMLVNNIFTILSYFFVSIPMFYMDHFSSGGFFFCMGGFVLYLAVMAVGQQKLVDFTKKLYPEKHGSVYDLKFEKVWFESCDEAERAIIGQASYASYKATTYTCLALWLVLVLSNIWFDFGLMPVAVVTVVWLVSSLSYYFKAKQLECRAHGSNGSSVL